MKTKVTREQWDQAEKWLAEGVTGKEVASRLNVSPGRVSQKLGKPRAKPETKPEPQ